MKKILFIIILLTSTLLFTTSSFAQQGSSLSAEEEAKMKQMANELGIAFPIAELNNCAGPKECRDFCGQESNHETCTRFAKKYGLDKKVRQETEKRKDEMLEKAKGELGCNSSESCSLVCEQNQEKCQQFARRHGYYNEQSQTKEYQERQSELVESARSELGCNSQESCNSYCQQEQNRERCKEFARQHSFDQGETHRDEDSARPTGPDGCRTEEECRRHYQEQQRTTTSPQSTGIPCDSPESCRKYCEKNPDKCRGDQTPQVTGHPQENYTPPPTGEPQVTGHPQENYTPPPTGEPQVTGAHESGSSTFDPQSKCTSTPGCSWTGSTCVCQVQVQGATTPNPYDFDFQYIIEIQNLLH